MSQRLYTKEYADSFQGRAYKKGDIQSMMQILKVFALANGVGKPSDRQDVVGIITLMVINYTINFIEENSTGNVAASLMAYLAPKAKVCGDGRCAEENVAILVPGAIISVKVFMAYVLLTQCIWETFV